MVLFLLNEITSHTFVLIINERRDCDVTHCQSLWRGRGDVNILFIGEWKNKSDQSERSIFKENKILLLIILTEYLKEYSVLKFDTICPLRVPFGLCELKWIIKLVKMAKTDKFNNMSS